MDKSQIDKMFAEAVKAKLEKSVSLGTHATWSMSDHLDVGAKIIAETVKDEVEVGQIRDALQAIYNHSAFAQRLEKAFAGKGHFQRSSQGKRTVDDVLTALAQGLA